jgi:hypothetical protein
MGFIPGLFKRVCDRTGFTVMSNRTVKQWNGLVVRKNSSEPRHPQQFVRGRSDPQTVPMARPRQVEEFLGPLTTKIATAAGAGDQVLTVETSVRFGDGDTLGVILDNGDIFRVVLMTVPSTTSLNLTRPLPQAAAVGNVITNYSAVAVAEIG